MQNSRLERARLHYESLLSNSKDDISRALQRKNRYHLNHDNTDFSGTDDSLHCDDSLQVGSRNSESRINSYKDDGLLRSRSASYPNTATQRSFTTPTNSNIEFNPSNMVTAYSSAHRNSNLRSPGNYVHENIRVERTRQTINENNNGDIPESYVAAGGNSSSSGRRGSDRGGDDSISGKYQQTNNQYSSGSKEAFTHERNDSFISERNGNEGHRKDSKYGARTDENISRNRSSVKIPTTWSNSDRHSGDNDNFEKSINENNGIKNIERNEIIKKYNQIRQNNPTSYIEHHHNKSQGTSSSQKNETNYNDISGIRKVQDPSDTLSIQDHSWENKNSIIITLQVLSHFLFLFTIWYSSACMSYSFSI